MVYFFTFEWDWHPETTDQSGSGKQKHVYNNAMYF